MFEVRLRLSLPMILAVAAGTAYLLKPSKASFNTYLNDWVAKKVDKKRELEKKEEESIFGVAEWLESATVQLVSKVATSFTSPVIKDYYVAQVATVKAGTAEYRFLGIYNTWFEVPTNEDVNHVIDRLQST